MAQGEGVVGLVVRVSEEMEGKTELAEERDNCDGLKGVE